MVNCKIWEAARATSAAATFFDPITIGVHNYVDGATGCNNPVEEVLREALSIWPNSLPRIHCIVSIGTGVPGPTDFGNDLIDVLKTLKTIATETETTAERFKESHTLLGLSGRYFRFNVNKGLEGVRLDEHAKVKEIEAAADLYLKSQNVINSASKLTQLGTYETGILSEFPFVWLTKSSKLSEERLIKRVWLTHPKETSIWGGYQCPTLGNITTLLVAYGSVKRPGDCSWRMNSIFGAQLHGLFCGFAQRVSCQSLPIYQDHLGLTCVKPARERLSFHQQSLTRSEIGYNLLILELLRSSTFPFKTIKDRTPFPSRDHCWCR